MKPITAAANPIPSAMYSQIFLQLNWNINGAAHSDSEEDDEWTTGCRRNRRKRKKEWHHGVLCMTTGPDRTGPTWRPQRCSGFFGSKFACRVITLLVSNFMTSKPRTSLYSNKKKRRTKTVDRETNAAFVPEIMSGCCFFVVQKLRRAVSFGCLTYYIAIACHNSHVCLFILVLLYKDATCARFHEL